jgi:hypothetical protein
MRAANVHWPERQEGYSPDAATTTAEWRAILLVFAACSQFRMPGFREHTRSQWKRVLDLGRGMEEQMRTATPEQKASMTHMGSLRSRDRKNGMNMEQVQQIVDKPLQTVPASHVRATVPLLSVAAAWAP